jgi:tetratricopeptide (TPR) repeat protein
MLNRRRWTVGLGGGVGLLIACSVASIAARASDKDDSIGQLKIEIGQLDGRIDALRAQLAASPGLKTDVGQQLELVAALAERARKRGHLEMELHPDRAYGANQDIQAILADRDAAVAMLGAILAERPDHPRVAEVLFLRSQVQREAGRYEQMLLDLSQLVERHPRSLQAAQALMVLGDYRFDRAELDSAARTYRQLIARPGPELKAQARYKLAWVAVNQADCQTALDLFSQVALEPDPQPGWDVLFQRASPVELRREALADMTYCYAQVGRPQAALEFFARFQMSSQDSVRVLSRLANRYFLLQQAPAALALYRYLLPLAEDPEERTEIAERIRELERAAR